MSAIHDHPEHARLRESQALLFPQSARQLADAIGLNWWAAVQLHAGGWLSFDPEQATALNERQEYELRFVGSLVTGGCDPFQVAGLLTGLERPYCYDGRRIYYDWAERRWRLLPTPSPEADPESIFDDWLAALKSDRNVARLEAIKSEVEEALRSLGPTPKGGAK